MAQNVEYADNEKQEQRQFSEMSILTDWLKAGSTYV